MTVGAIGASLRSHTAGPVGSKSAIAPAWPGTWRSSPSRARWDPRQKWGPNRTPRADSRAPHVEAIGIGEGLGVPVGRAVEGHHLGARRDLLTADLGVGGGKAPLVHDGITHRSISSTPLEGRDSSAARRARWSGSCRPGRPIPPATTLRVVLPRPPRAGGNRRRTGSYRPGSRRSPRLRSGSAYPGAAARAGRRRPLGHGRTSRSSRRGRPPPSGSWRC